MPSQNPQYPKVKNTNEKDTYRNENGIVTTAGSLNFNNTTGQESISLASQSGDDITFSNKVASFFHPNNKMEKVNSNKFSTVEGDSSTYVGKTREVRVVGDLRVLTGVSDFFTEENKVQSDYVELRSKIAAAGVQPPTQVGGITNNSKGKLKQEGTPAPPEEGGSTDGKTFAPNPGHDGYGDFVEGQASKATKLEKKMGVGGSIMLMAGKHLILSAGTKASSFDSGYINPIGRKINSSSAVETNDDGSKKIVQKFGAVATYQEKDTYSNMPFGSIDIIGNNKIAFKAGAGGIDFQGGGSMKMVGSGLTLLGGAQVSVTGTGCVTIDTPHTEITGNTVNVSCGETQIDSNVTIVGDVNITGNLTVQGTIHATGGISTDATVHATGNITTDADAKASGISLVNHVHGGVTSGGSKTAVPQ
jgi:phage baseplate assembly protein gpV